MTNIKHVGVYHDDILNLIDDYAPEALDNLTEDQKDDIAHACDYEDLLFIVVNHETVIESDEINGDVFAITPLDEFVRTAIEQILNEEE